MHGMLGNDKAKEKNRAGKGDRKCWWGWGERWGWHCREGGQEVLNQKTAQEERPEGREGMRHADMWAKSILSRGTSKCEGPKVGHTSSTFQEE